MTDLTPSIEDGNLIMRDQDGFAVHVIPLEAIASWRILLGLGSDSEAVAAILQASDPGVLDTETGRNAWTSAYEQCERERLLDLNQVDAAATRRAVAPVSLALVDDGRAETRRLLGLPSGSVMAMRLMSEEDESPVQSIPMPDGVDTDELDAILSDTRIASRIRGAESRFVDGLLPAGGR